MEVFRGLADSLVHRRLRGQLGPLLVLVDQVQESINQVVVDLAKAMVGKTQQIQPRRSLRHALQLVNGVELEQRRIILAALLGYSRRGQKGLGERVQWLKEFAAVDFLAKLLVSEVLGLALEYADTVDAIVGLQHPVQLLFNRRCHGAVQLLRKPVPFLHHHAGNHVLQ